MTPTEPEDDDTHDWPEPRDDPDDEPGEPWANDEEIGYEGTR